MNGYSVRGLGGIPGPFFKNNILKAAVGCNNSVLCPVLGKERLAFRLREQGWEVHDCGTDSTEAADYPEFAHEVAGRVASGASEWGIVVDGAGIGSSMVANKVPGVRAALCYDLSSAANSREHNHANVLTLGAGLVGESLAWQIVQTWLGTPWSEGRHARRVAMIDEVDRRYRALSAREQG